MRHLARWISTSIAAHFEPVATGLSLPYFVEGIDERDKSTMRADHVECRMTGPFIKEPSKDWFIVEMGINFLLTKQMVIAGADAYCLERWVARFMEVMLGPISIYKYGSDMTDDGSLLGCLFIKKTTDEAVRVWHFGQISKEDKLKQSEMDALYGMDLITI